MYQAEKTYIYTGTYSFILYEKMSLKRIHHPVRHLQTSTDGAMSDVYWRFNQAQKWQNTQVGQEINNTKIDVCC